MNADESEPWMQKMKRHFQQQGHGDDWQQAAKDRFTAASVSATNDGAAADIARYLEGGQNAERMAKALDIESGAGAESDNDGDSGETEATDGELTAAFNPHAERESNALELEF